MVRYISLFRMLNLALLIIVNKSLSFQNKSLRSFSPSSDGERVLLYRTLTQCPQRLQKRYRPYRSRRHRGAERERRHRTAVQRCGKVRRVAARWRREEGLRERGRVIAAAHVRWECSLWPDEGRQVSCQEKA